jgi:hypothetical protein
VPFFITPLSNIPHKFDVKSLDGHFRFFFQLRLSSDSFPASRRKEERADNGKSLCGDYWDKVPKIPDQRTYKEKFKCKERKIQLDMSMNLSRLWCTERPPE